MSATAELIDLNVQIADAVNPILKGRGVAYVMVIQKDDRFTYSTNLTSDLEGAAEMLQHAISQFHLERKQ
jgi:hypothetical protein